MLNSLVWTYFSEPFLNNGMMFASFHSKGTNPSFNDKLNTLASGILVVMLCLKRTGRRRGGGVILHNCFY